ncbi:MAG: biopolymer transporter ExbD [Planctomycetota bacterium]|nr:biopolymer transporter ExbD [Planctomycetota bacterium]
MKFAAHAAKRGRAAAVLNLTSMIDATFLLLSYFIFTTGTGHPESELSAQLRMQSQRMAGTGLLESQVVDVLPDGPRAVFRLGVMNYTNQSALRDALKGLPHDPGLLVRVHAGTVVSDVAAAMQAAGDAGFKQVSYVPAE